MITSFTPRSNIITVNDQVRRATIRWWLWFACLIGITTLLGLSMARSGPNLKVFGWFVYIASVTLIFYCPRYGVYLIMGLGMAADSALVYWYPMIKNFSSGESLLFLHNAIIFSPLESFLVLTYVSWLGRAIIQRKLTSFYTGLLFWPTMLFIAFITFGLVYGLGRGGNVNIGLWESRSIYYLPLMLVLTSNLIETRRHVNILLWLVMIAIFINGFIGSWFVATVLKFDLSTVDRIAGHPSSVHANTFFIMVIGSWMFGASYARRLILPVMMPFVLLSFFANQRRAAFVTLAIALVFVFAVLYWHNRKAFFLIAPVAAIVGTLYIGAFWNSSGVIGMPARAIKSVVAEDASSERDQSSNLYRILENINILFTIRMSPLIGVGFGQKFHIIAPMADISFFDWWEYIPHNSVMWIWIKTGIGGFLAMLFMVGLSIIKGFQVLARMPGGDLSAIALTAVLYIIMHFIFAYVDMSWEPQSMIYIGMSMGLINSLERIVAQPVPIPPKRWPWQPDPLPIPGLRPL